MTYGNPIVNKIVDRIIIDESGIQDAMNERDGTSLAMDDDNDGEFFGYQSAGAGFVQWPNVVYVESVAIVHVPVGEWNAGGDGGTTIRIVEIASGGVFGVHIPDGEDAETCPHVQEIIKQERDDLAALLASFGVKSH